MPRGCDGGFWRFCCPAASRLGRLEITALPPKPAPSIEQLLDGAVDDLDALLGEVRGGIRGPGHFDTLEAEATRIAGAVRDAFRRGVR